MALVAVFKLTFPVCLKVLLLMLVNCKSFGTLIRAGVPGDEVARLVPLTLLHHQVDLISLVDESLLLLVCDLNDFIAFLDNGCCTLLVRLVLHHLLQEILIDLILDLIFHSQSLLDFIQIFFRGDFGNFVVVGVHEF